MNNRLAAPHHSTDHPEGRQYDPGKWAKARTQGTTDPYLSKVYMDWRHSSTCPA